MYVYHVSEILTRICAQYQTLIAMGEQKNVVVNTVVTRIVRYKNL
jgi:hypothetical protein